MKGSIRKGCNWCGIALISFKEKVTRTCNDCANKALGSANTMSSGKVKQGYQELRSLTGTDNELMDKKIELAIEKKRNKIIKKAKKQGLKQEQIEEALKIFEDANKK